MTRPNLDTYLMNIAKTAATRATCDRKHVGAVIARDGNILATGYNGSAAGLPHCDDIGHLMEDGHCVRTVHAEMNAICQAAKHGNAIDEATIYVTASPCWNCWLALANVGITRIVYDEVYRSNVEKYEYNCVDLGIELVHLKNTSAISVVQAFAGGPIITAKERPVEPTRNPDNETLGYTGGPAPGGRYND